MYTSIVVPLDGSAFANRALPIALILASRSDAAVTLVNVAERGTLADGLPTQDARLSEDLQRENQSALGELAARLTDEAALRVDAEFLEGPVVSTLQRYLAGRCHDLVVMMTHGRRGLSRAWFGSVADGLVRNATIPLLLMRDAAERTGDPVEPLFHRVLVPLDGSPLAEEVLDHVVSLGTPDVTVFVLLTIVVPSHALDFPDSVPLSDHGGDGAWREAAVVYLAGVAAELRESGALVEVCVEMHAQPAQAILDAAARQHADLIALSTHGRGAMSRIGHGSVADEVVRGAAVPTFVYRPERAGHGFTEGEHGADTVAAARKR